MSSPFTCVDCKGPITGTVAENAALAAGVRICIGCIESMEVERDAYLSEMARPCDFFDRQIAAAQRRIALEHVTPSEQGQGEV